LLRRIVLLVALVALSAWAGVASAQPPITGTEVSTFSESFSEPFFCGGELYAVTASGRMVVHFTFLEETGALHFHEVAHGKAVSVRRDRSYLHGELLE
jgi:hypothetical protein